MSAALETSGVDRFVYIHVEWNVGCAYEDEVVAQTSIKVTDRTGASAARTYKNRRMKIGPTVKRNSDECERTRNADDNARRSKSVQSIKNVSHKTIQRIVNKNRRKIAAGGNKTCKRNGRDTARPKKIAEVKRSEWTKHTLARKRNSKRSE